MRFLFALMLFAVLAAPVAGQDDGGLYGGVQLGTAAGAPGAESGQSVSGFFIGYGTRRDAIVLRGEVDHGQVNIDLGGGATINSVTRLKLLGGYRVGDGVLYGAAGLGLIPSRPPGDGGLLLGAGFDFDLGRRVSVGSEVLYHDFSAVTQAGRNGDLLTLSARIALEF